MYRILNGIVTSGLGTIFWSTLLKLIWREGYWDAENFLTPSGRIQAAPIKIVMPRGMDWFGLGRER